MGVKTYDASQVAMLFGPIEITDGLADGTFVSVEQNEDSFALTVGADGEACRSKTNNKSGRVTFTVLQSSLANDLLSAAHNLDVASPNGDGIAPLMVKDNSGRTIVAAEKAWIVRQPTTEFAREVSSREWIIETDALNSQVGGN